MFIHPERTLSIGELRDRVRQLNDEIDDLLDRHIRSSLEAHLSGKPYSGEALRVERSKLIKLRKRLVKEMQYRERNHER